MTIRPATPEDRDAVKAVWEPSTEWLGPFGLAWWRYWNAPALRSHWDVAVDGHGTIVGFVHWHELRNGTRTVYEVAVSPSARRARVGSWLMAHVSRPVRLKVRLDNLRAISFYEKIGLTIASFSESRDHRFTYARMEGS